MDKERLEVALKRVTKDSQRRASGMDVGRKVMFERKVNMEEC